MSATTCVKAEAESEMKCMLNSSSYRTQRAHVDSMPVLINETLYVYINELKCILIFASCCALM